MSPGPIVTAMDLLAPAAGAIVAAVVGWFAAANQHRLYSEPLFQQQPMTGARARNWRMAVAAASAVMAAIALRPDHYDLGPGILTAAFGFVLVLISSTDFERHRIPNVVSYPTAAAAAALCWAWPDRDAADIAVGAGFALVAGVIFFGLGLLASRGGTGLGLGDVKLMLVIGLVVGWPTVMFSLFLGVMLAGIPAVILIVRGKVGAHFAYGPYLAAGGLVGMLFPNLLT